MANALHALCGLLKINQLRFAIKKTKKGLILFTQLQQVQQSHHDRLPRLQTDVVENEKTVIKGKTYRWDEVEELHTRDCRYCCCL